MVGVMVAARSLESMVKESAARFLQELPTGACDLAGFRSIFFRLLQSSPDPPLDAVWFYAAAAFREARASGGGPGDRAAAARDLFQLLSACSAGCRGAESVALLAPVVCEVHRLVGELKGGGFSSKKGRKLAGLVEAMVGYIGICSCRDDDCGGRTVCLLDLVRVWTGEEGEEGFVVFFPLVDDRVRSVLRKEVGVEYLAAVVMLEAFLLMLRLKLRGGGPRTELQKEIKSWAVGAITAFRSPLFFGEF